MMTLSAAGWAGSQLALSSVLTWIFIPLTLAFCLMLAVSETIYSKTGKGQWNDGTVFWSGLFGAGLVLSLICGLTAAFSLGFNYPGFLAVFDTPLVLGAIIAIALTACAYSANIRLRGKGSNVLRTLSAWTVVAGTIFIILCVTVASVRAEYPAGIRFNTATMSIESTDFWAHFSDLSINKFLHTLSSSLLVGGVCVLGICCLNILAGKKKEMYGRYASIAAAIAVAGAAGTAGSANASIFSVARHEPVKLAAMYSIKQTVSADTCQAYSKLSMLVNGTPDGKIVGTENAIKGGYPLPDGSRAMGIREKAAWGNEVLNAVASYRQAVEQGDEATVASELAFIEKYQNCTVYAGLYGQECLTPDIKEVSFWFTLMKVLGAVLAIFLVAALILVCTGKLTCGCSKWFHITAVAAIPCALVCAISGWMLSVSGCRPWIIQDIIPSTSVAHSESCTAVASIILIVIVLASCCCVSKSICRIIGKDEKDIEK